MDRRSFLRGALALTVAPVVAQAALAANLPVIYGDGIHDDWAGLQALFDGKPFVVEGNAFTANAGELRGGSFLISRTLEMRAPNIDVEDCRFRLTDNFDGACCLRLHHGAACPRSVVVTSPPGNA